MLPDPGPIKFADCQEFELIDLIMPKSVVQRVERDDFSPRPICGPLFISLRLFWGTVMKTN